MGWRKELQERSVARINKPHEHRWADKMGEGARLGEVTPKSTGKGTALFQVCIDCGMVRQVSE